MSARAICPQQPNIFLTSNNDDVDQSWKQGSFHWFLPRTPSDQKNGGSTLDAPRFAGRKEWPLKLFSSSWRLFEQKLCSPFCTEMIRLPGSIPELELHGLACSATIRSLKVEWTSHACMRMRWIVKHGRSIAKTCSPAVSGHAYAVEFES